jgi:Fe-S-cluster-containing dehydrogenase component
MLLQFKQEEEFFMDPQRCIGCHACEMACAECETNGQTPMVSVDYVARYYTPQTSVQICMHCEDPTCAKVCPADAIQKDEFGIVHSANTARCISCSNCVYACPFGVPKKAEPMQLMIKCTCATIAPASARSRCAPRYVPVAHSGMAPERRCANCGQIARQ